MRTRAKEWAARIVLALVALGLALAVVEVAGRVRFADTPYVRGPQIRTVQSLLAPNARVGFLWRPNMEPARDAVIAWSDAEPFTLSTDAEGFKNVPDAIALRRTGRGARRGRTRRPCAPRSLPHPAPRRCSTSGTATGTGRARRSPPRGS